MRTKTRYHVAAGLLLVSLIVASQKSLACNEPPVANISNWFQIVAPGDRIFLDGTDSYDPDGYITDWYWQYPGEAYDVSGQGHSRFYCNIDEAGIYGFSLSVTDNEGAWDWDSATVYVVGAQTIEYDDPDLGWTSAGTLYVHLGTTVTFRAIPAPGSSWPSGKPVWGGTAGASGTGSTKSVQFNTLSTSPTDYKTVTVECGNLLVANVVVYQLYPYWEFFDEFEGRSRNRCGLEELASLHYMTEPDGLSGLPIEWLKLGGVGSLVGTIYDAEHTAGGVSLRCEITASPSKGIGTTYSWSVAAPSGTRMTRVNPNKVWHIYGVASAGIALYYWLNPKDVSFGFLDFGEGTCPATNATGIYVSVPPGDHPENGPFDITYGDITNGCRVVGKDHAGTWRNPWAPGGTYTWSIPTQYIDYAGTRHDFGSNQIQTAPIQSNGFTTISKGGQSGSAAVYDDPSDWE